MQNGFFSLIIQRAEFTQAYKCDTDFSLATSNAKGNLLTHINATRNLLKTSCKADFFCSNVTVRGILLKDNCSEKTKHDAVKNQYR